jgi:hypothetical protein
VHAALLARAGDPEQALELFRLACRLDLDDLTGTSAGGLHVAAMRWGLAGPSHRVPRAVPVRRCAGPRPHLPGAREAVEQRLRYHGLHLRVRAGYDHLELATDGLVPVRLPGCRLEPWARPARAGDEPGGNEGGAEVSTILAAIDASAAAQPVVDTAVALGRVLQLPVVGFHVRQDTVESEQQLAARAAVELRPPVRAGPAGSTALAVATRVTKPVVVVPPEPRDPPSAGLQRVLVPLDGTATTASAVEQVTRWFAGSDVGIVSLHVFDVATVPSF